MSVRGWEHLKTTVLSGTASSVSFASLSDEYRRFMLCTYVLRDGNAAQVFVRTNNDSGTNYAQQRVSADNTTVAGQRLTGQAQLAIAAYANLPATTGLGQFTVLLSKPTSGVVGRMVSSGSYFADLATDAILLDIVAGEWTNMSALITRIDVISSANNFAAGTRIVMFGSRR